MTNKSAISVNSKRLSKRAANPGFNSAALDALAEEVCSGSDPFCRAAYGSTRAVGSSTPTIPFTIKTVYTVLTGSSGDAWFVLYPGASTTCASNFPVSNPDWPAVTTPATNIGAFPSFASGARVVSAGISWHDIAPSTDAGGYVTVINVSAPADALYDNTGHSFSSMINSNESYITDRHDPGLFSVSPTNNIQADEFTQTPTAVDSVANPWPAVALAISGKAATNVLQVEVVVHWELTLNESSVPGTTHQERSLVQKVINAGMGGYFQGVKSRFTEYVKQKAKQRLKRLVNQGFNAGMNYISGGGYGMLTNSPNVITVD